MVLITADDHWHLARLRAWHRAVLPLAAAMLLAVSCDSSGGGNSGGTDETPTEIVPVTEPITPAPFTESFIAATPSNVPSSTVSLVDISASVPQDSLAMGIAVFGTSPNLIVIEHQGVIFGGNDSITGPGGPVPLSFNTLYAQPAPSAINYEAVAVHFPNDGRHAALPVGPYSFPVVAYNSAGTDRVADTLNSVLFYKTVTSFTPTLKLNVFVLNGVDAGIMNQAQAANDAEILGALAVLQNVYGNNAAIGVNVVATVTYVNDGGTCLSTPGVISDPDGIPDNGNDANEQFCLLSSYPTTPTNDAMNIFVISSLDYLDPANPGGGVIGLAAGIPGPFNLQGFATSGTLAEYQNDGIGTVLGFTLAHEFGHYLGLFHTSQTSQSLTSIIGEDPISDTALCTDAEILQGLSACSDFGNLMFPFVNNDSDPPVSTGQGNVVKYNPGITP